MKLIDLYVVLYDTTDIEGIYSTKELAIQYMNSRTQLYKKHLTLESYLLDQDITEYKGNSYN